MQGAAFLEEQLASFAAQTRGDWRVWASDDGSTDGTAALLETCRQEWGDERLTVVRGPGRGFAANFLSLAARSDIQAAYYAFADQDDIWEPEKLARALTWLESVPPHQPALHCGRTRLISEQGDELGFSPLFSRPPGFANALVQSIAGGNTMVFNHAARLLLMEAGPVDVITHDWWTYLLVSGCGGVVQYDPVPMVRYRQHDDNLIGSNIGWSAWVRRGGLLFEGCYKTWNSRNLSALQQMQHRLTGQNRQTLQLFEAARHGGVCSRLKNLRRSGVYRQTVMGSIGLVAAACLNKI